MLARLFQARFAKQAVVAGLLGAGSASLVAAVVRALGRLRRLPADPAGGVERPAWLAICPVIAAGALAAIAARRTAMELLADVE
jgi:hypothetical protein